MRRLGIVFALLVAALGGLAGAAWWWLHQPLTLESDPVELSVELGATPREIADAWVKAGIRALTIASAVYPVFCG